MTKPYDKKRYFALTLDPVHVGTGGYRLGHVDNTIIREPGSNLPKIPGSSLNGVLRAYAAMVVQGDNKVEPKRNEKGLWSIDCKEYQKMTYLRPAYGFSAKENGQYIINIDKDGQPLIKKDKNNNDIYYSCAGKGIGDGEGHCGQHDCPVCTAFGFSRSDKGSFQGLVQFYDLRILLFPVYTSSGTFWLTSPSLLEDACIGCPAENITENRFASTIEASSLYFGGFEFKKDQDKSSALSLSETIPKAIRERIVIVTDSVCARLINDNLEVRTSVAIDPATGAADDGALFTYEAIPRSTIMWFDVVYNKPEFFRINNKAIGFNIEELRQTIEKSMGPLEALGIGGMNTRGMGRVRVLNLEVSTV
jgi:CRISPR-associated protein Cmr4